MKKTDERVIRLGDERYIRVKTYRSPDRAALASLSDEQFVAKLMRQPFYDHLLVGPVEHDEKNEIVQGPGQHGPYALDRLSPDLYERISKEEFRRRLQEHYEDPFYKDEGPVSESTVCKIDRFLGSLPLSACRILRLALDPAENPGERKHFGDAPLHSDFHEYIFVEEDCLHLFIIAWD